MSDAARLHRWVPSDPDAGAPTQTAGRSGPRRPLEPGSNPAPECHRDITGPGQDVARSLWLWPTARGGNAGRTETFADQRLGEFGGEDGDDVVVHGGVHDDDDLQDGSVPDGL
ncbi:MAG: hypothetical protein NVS1B12_17170 [Acidimicrobiales bacterium]